MNFDGILSTVVFSRELMGPLRGFPGKICFRNCAFASKREAAIPSQPIKLVYRR